MTTLHLLALGCGTVGHHNVEALLGDSSVAAAVTRFDAVDCKRVSERNGYTVPWLRGREGESKAACLRQRAAVLAGRPLAGATHDECVESLDWNRLLDAGNQDAPADRMIIVLIGLDNWSSKVSAVSDVRQAAAATGREVLIVQAAVDRGQAQVGVFGSRWDAACPACGILGLPSTEPCVVFREGGRLLRGDLGREAGAAAAEVLAVVKDCLATGETSRWPDRKINLVSDDGGQGFTKFMRVRPMVPGCWGPHSSDTPMRAEELLAG
jgi:hypothetical protein